MRITQLLLFLVCISCLAQKNENKNILSIPSMPNIVYEIGNGEMFEGAIKIKNAKNSTERIEAETKYMEHKFGIINIDWKPFGSEFYKVKRKQYNLIHIQIFNKEDKTKEEFKTIYFDITDCWEL